MILTVGQLRVALEGVPDTTPVRVGMYSAAALCSEQWAPPTDYDAKAATLLRNGAGQSHFEIATDDDAESSADLLGDHHGRNE